jgi:hypothetical protein
MKLKMEAPSCHDGALSRFTFLFEIERKARCLRKMRQVQALNIFAHSGLKSVSVAI